MNKEDKNYYLELWKEQRCGVITEINNANYCTMIDTGEPVGYGPRCTGCPYY